MKKRLIILSLFVFIVSCFVFFNPFKGIGSEQDIVYGSIKSNTVDVYAKPDGKSEKIKRLKANTPFFIIKTQQENDEEWYFIDAGSVRGWVKQDDQANIESLEIENVRAIVLDSSDMTTEPKKDAKKVRSMTKGTPISIKNSQVDENHVRWLNVVSENDEGWIQLENVTLAPSEKKIAEQLSFIKENADVRAFPNVKAASLAVLHAGEKVMLQKEQTYQNGDKWYEVTVHDQKGYIQSEHLAKQMPIQAQLFAGSLIQVKKKAEESAKTIAEFQKGMQLFVVEQLVDTKNNLWYKISLNQKQIGYVPAKLLTDQKPKIAYITVDDGPTKDTGTMLNIFKKYNAKATFFMVNNHMLEHPEFVKQMLADGHAIGSHSVSHNAKVFYASSQSVVNEMATCRTTIKNITGIDSNLIRVPYGSHPLMKPDYFQAVKQNGFILWDWNVDSLDWKFNNANYVNYALQHVRHVEARGDIPIILIHDRPATIQSLDALLQQLTNEGYTLLPINESMTPFIFPH